MGKLATPYWPAVNAELIAEQCSPRHIQTVIEYAQRDIARLTAINAELVEALENAIALIAHKMGMDTSVLVAGKVLTAREVWRNGNTALARAKENSNG